MVSIGRESAIIETGGATGAATSRAFPGRGDAMAAAVLVAHGFLQLRTRVSGQALLDRKRLFHRAHRTTRRAPSGLARAVHRHSFVIS